MSEGAGSDLEAQSAGLSMVQVSIPNQGIQSVIQSANQQSIIQTTGHNSVIQTAGHGVSTIQVVRVAQVEEEEDPDVKRRREILSRRPSYRKILNDLSSPVSVKLDEESNSSLSQDGDSQDAGLGLQYQNATVVQGGIQLSVNQDNPTIPPGIQTLTMTNASPSTTAAASTGATIVQYAQGPDGQQFYIPVGSTGTMQAYQIATSGTIPQGVVMSAGNPAISSPQQLSEEAARKRELRLLKNRDAAKECRRKKKDYVKCLENRVAVLENQNKTLIEELKALKELYCQTDM